MRQLLCLFLFLAVPLYAAFAQDPVDQVITEALKPSALEANLHRLTDEIGGRVPGTAAMRRAVEWGVEAFKAAGADSVHTEDFSLPISWAEGGTEMFITAPAAQFRVRAVSVAWAPALPLHRHVRVIDVGDGGVEDFERGANLAGALLLVHSEEMKKWDDLFAEYLRAPGIIDRALKGKALAVAFQSTRPNDLLYRHANASAGELDRLPMLVVAREDAGRVARLLASGQVLYSDLSIPNHIGGPDVLRAIKASGSRPRRSIRFVLFSGEEEGMVGSRAYTVAHNAELDKAVGVVILDSGVGRVTGFSLGGRRDVVEAATALVAPLKQFDATALTADADWGTDNFDFLLQGVPTFVANQEEYNYLLNYHAMSDTFDKVDLAQLKKHVAEAAALTLGVANALVRPGPRLHHAQIEQTLRETHLDEQLKTFGLWSEWESGKLGRKD